VQHQMTGPSVDLLAASAALAWERTLGWFGRHLAG